MLKAFKWSLSDIFAPPKQRELGFHCYENLTFGLERGR